MVDLFKEASDGAKAASLLENDIYKSVMSGLRQALHERWEKAPVRDLDGQQHLKLMLKLLNDLEANIKEIATTGKLASLQIEEEREKESRLSKIMNFGRN